MKNEELLNIPNCDPAWDYYSIAETKLSMDESCKKLSKILCSPQAENGNPNTDHQVLRLIAKIKGDCNVIENALAPDANRLCDKYSSDNLRMDNSLESISDNLRQACGYLARISMKLIDIERSIDHLADK